MSTITYLKSKNEVYIMITDLGEDSGRGENIIEVGRIKMGYSPPPSPSLSLIDNFLRNIINLLKELSFRFFFRFLKIRFKRVFCYKNQ